jgi:hypothetical protein
MSNIIKKEAFDLTTMSEVMQYADMLAKSSMVPKGYQGKPGDIVVAIQMGRELGLKPIQSLQNIAVINGKPSIYGDACLALVKNHPAFEDIKEWHDEATGTAHCEIKRKGQSVHKTSFSKEDAKKAGLLGKQGPWTQYEKRMLQMRARGFGVRDVFPDALQGLILAEEAQDYPMENITPSEAPLSKASALANLIPPPPVAANDTTAEVVTMVQAPSDEVRKKSELLTMLVMNHDVEHETVEKWLTKANARTFSEFDEVTLDKCIAYVKEKYKDDQ